MTEHLCGNCAFWIMAFHNPLAGVIEGYCPKVDELVDDQTPACEQYYESYEPSGWGVQV